jgi:hypothetical protein
VIENRREAVRVTIGEPGQLIFSGRRVECVVLDVSALGVRVHVEAPRLIPDRITLRTTIAGEPIDLPARIRRAEPGLVLALQWADPENSRLHRLIADAQRDAISKGRRAHVERRHSPR